MKYFLTLDITKHLNPLLDIYHLSESEVDRKILKQYFENLLESTFRAYQVFHQKDLENPRDYYQVFFRGYNYLDDNPQLRGTLPFIPGGFLIVAFNQETPEFYLTWIAELLNARLYIKQDNGEIISFKS